MFCGVSFPQIVKFVDFLGCREGPLMDTVLWEYHINAYDFVHCEYDPEVDRALHRLTGLHIDNEC